MDSSPESPAPLPLPGPLPPMPYRCPNCGENLTGAGALCPRCGARLAERPAGAGTGKILGAIFLGLLAVPLALAGSCFALIGTAGGAETSSMALIAAPLLGAAALCVFGIIKLLQRK